MESDEEVVIVEVVVPLAVTIIALIIACKYFTVGRIIYNMVFGVNLENFSHDLDPTVRRSCRRASPRDGNAQR